MIAVSMRVVPSDYGEWRDAISHDLVDYIADQGYGVLLIPNQNEIALEYLEGIKLLILSGGDDLLPARTKDDHAFRGLARRDITESRLLKASVTRRIPVLGICRGAQLINIFFGGTCEKLPSSKHHVAVDHDVTIRTKKGLQLSNSNPRMCVNSYHTMGISRLGEGVVPTAISADGEIEAVEHQTLPVIGIMWHPERTCSDPDFDRIHGDLLNRLMAGSFA